MMERLIYCPSEEHLEEASAMAADCSLPICVGISEKINSLNFDKSIVQVLHIPEDKNMFLLSKEIRLGFHQIVLYVNDFCNTYKTCELRCNGEVVKPLYSEAHRVRWSFVTESLGENTVELFQDGSSLFMETFNVYQ